MIAGSVNRELSLRIIDAGLDRLNIFVEGINVDEYKDFSK
jgi:hypothetical protein